LSGKFKLKIKNVKLVTYQTFLFWRTIGVGWGGAVGGGVKGDKIGPPLLGIV
jgi:hypothetical protein